MTKAAPKEVNIDDYEELSSPDWQQQLSYCIPWFADLIG